MSPFQGQNHRNKELTNLDIHAVSFYVACTVFIYNNLYTAASVFSAEHKSLISSSKSQDFNTGQANGETANEGRTEPVVIDVFVNYPLN